MTLDEIGRKHGTDKASLLPDGSEGHGYLDIYEDLFSLSDECPCGQKGCYIGGDYRILEIGTEYGKSIRTWAEAYPNAVIIGIDKEPLWYPDTDCRTGVGVHQLDVTNSEGFNTFLANYGPFDFIIDDASHQGEITVPTFYRAWSQLYPGGWYAIEDCQTDFARNGWPTQHGMLRSFVVELFAFLNENGTSDIAEVRMHKHLLLIRKREK